MDNSQGTRQAMHTSADEPARDRHHQAAMMAKRRTSDVLQANLVYAVVFLVSLLLIIFYETGWLAGHPTLQSLMKEIGSSGLVAIILIYTIERITRERHQKAADELIERINTDIFRAIYKRRVPEPVFVEFERLLLTANVYRTQLEVIYTLKALDSDPAFAPNDRDAYLHCLIQSSFELQNLTDSEIVVPIYVFVDAPAEPRFERHCGIVDIRIGGASLVREVIEQHVKRVEGGTRFNSPIRIEPNGSVRIITSVAQIKPMANTEFWISSYPSSGLSLTVNTPGRDLDVSARAAHTQRLELDINNDVTKRWTLRRGLLPSQSVYFWWKPAGRPVVAPE